MVTDVKDDAAAKKAAAKKSTPSAPAKAKAKKPKRKKDGTVGDFKGDVDAFNNRPNTVVEDERGNKNVEAVFRSATGHNEDKNVGGVPA